MRSRSTPFNRCLVFKLDYVDIEKDKKLSQQIIISRFDLENCSRSMLKEILFEKMKDTLNKIEKITAY